MNPNLIYWLSINKINGLGPVTIKKLYEHFKSIEAVWHASPQEIQQIEGLRKDAVLALLKQRNQIDLNEEINRLGDIKALCLEDDEYPRSLKNIYDPPPVLYIKGNFLPVDENAIAIVGTRNASYYGKTMAEKFARELVSAGFTIVSGLAIGIDAVAHESACLAQGRTIAVLGGGVDNISPRCNLSVAEKIERSGAIVSEFPLGTVPDKTTFPRRNRIIAGLSKGVIVVEGSEDSGSLITARFALDEGREVFAVPGSIDSEGSKGPHALIKQGAKLVASIDDVLEEFNIGIPNPETRIPIESRIPNHQIPNLSEEEKKVYTVLSREPKHIDMISVETKLQSHIISGILLNLEIKKIVKQLPGKCFVSN